MRTSGFWHVLMYSDGMPYLKDGEMIKAGKPDFTFGTPGAVYPSSKFPGYYAFDVSGSIGTQGQSESSQCVATISAKMHTGSCASPDGLMSADVKVNLHKGQDALCETLWCVHLCS